MKLRRLVIHDIDYKPLMKGIDLFFPKWRDNYIHASCFIGVNGSGKSQVLEIIAEIFLFLDRTFRKQNKSKNLSSPFAFRIEYEVIIKSKEYLVIFDCPKIKTKEKDIQVEILKKEDEEFKFDVKSIYEFLPSKIVGYTSGDNETLSLPFDSYYDEYATYTGNRAKYPEKFKDSLDYDPKLYFMNYNTNLGIAISSLIFESDIQSLKEVKKILKLKKLISFQITIQTLQQEAPAGGVVLTEELEGWREKLINCSSSSEYIEKHNKYILNYELDDVTVIAFKRNFTDALELYTCLYKFELLNNLIVKKEIRTKIEIERRNRKLVTKMPMVADIDKVLGYSELKLQLENGNIVDYLSLSDGEHQFLNVFGTILMINQDNSLFLLDEPETHFNPKWRRTFISTLKDITNGRKQDMIITSHSPFIVSDSKRENVFIFKREDEKISISEPSKESYGASFDNILDMAFDIEIPISQKSLNEIEELEKETNPDIIKSKISNFGESLEKIKLLDRVIMLNSKLKE